MPCLNPARRGTAAAGFFSLSALLLLDCRSVVSSRAPNGLRHSAFVHGRKGNAHALTAESLLTHSLRSGYPCFPCKRGDDELLRDSAPHPARPRGRAKSPPRFPERKKRDFSRPLALLFCSVHVLEPMQGAPWLPAELSRRSRVRINRYSLSVLECTTLTACRLGCCMGADRCRALRRFFDVLFTPRIRVVRRRPLFTRSNGGQVHALLFR